MSTDEPSTERASTGATPADVYSRRLHALNLEQTAESRHERLLGYCKLTLAAVALVAALLFLHFLRHLEFLLAAVREFAGVHPQNDDITALIVRCLAD